MEKGKAILTIVAGMEVVAGFLADWNRTHLFNPRWTPHAKFHDALSISMASMNGMASLYLLYVREGNEDQRIKLAAIISGIPCLAMALSYAFPGAKGLEAEFPKLVPKIGKIWLSEWAVGVTGLALLGLGLILKLYKIK
jgi:hypothetical protein